MCNHRWRYRNTLSRAECCRCGVQVERVWPDPDGRWQLWKVAMRAAMRAKPQATVLA
ncbi:hypothetical protein SAMN05216229_12365 [Geopseudomonas sagittaria]|uniref:Uncharacterized protein n=1 Tax=Geopseudomonas sagittaria TaxID=1135990 RepID=A0A1I5YRK1_9GAMM|nr:hypothetical protein [Pseudomonas sagittaria]SFQ46873.1 hypothetical protein SAMN05216229_12365 [Pseudomonas sagittaria]